MKKKFAVWFLSLALLLPLLPTAQAASTTTYNYAVEGGNLKFDPTTGTIVGCEKNVYSADIPGEIYGVPVTAIGKNAFYNCTKLASVTIPTTVTTIGSSAFYHCTALKSIVIPSSVTVMDYGNAIYGIFSYCTGLESVTIPGSVKRLSDSMFSSCSNLKTVNLEYGVEEIGRHAFWRCTSLESITFPDSVKSIEAYAFRECTNLRTVTFGSGVKSIADVTFTETGKLESLYFRGNAPSATSRMINKFADGFIIYYPAGATGWTTPTWNGYITRSYSPTPSQPTMVTAKPTASTVYVNGTVVAFDAYNINNNNYFKLRDIGQALDFSVEWNGVRQSIEIDTSLPYRPE